MSFWKTLFTTRKSSKPNHTSLSQRGSEGMNTPLRPDMDLFFKAKEDQWHPTTNPDGKFPLNVAENNLCWDLMEEKIQKVFASRPNIPDWVSGYTDMTGDPAFREALASFLSDNLCYTSIDPNHIMTAAGATAIIELAAWILCDEGDVAALPAPCYPVYTQDIFNKAKVQRHDIVTHHDLDAFRNGHPLRLLHLEKAKKDIEKKGQSLKMIILTTPDNPTGSVYDFAFLKDAAQWCHAHHIHLIVNELYGLSVIDTMHSDIAMDYSDRMSFLSFAKVMAELKSDYLHLAYGLSKDFGMSGFRVGLLYSMNADLKAAWGNLGAPHLVSNLTQWLMSEILSDQEFVDNFITENQKRLTENYVTVIKTLKKLSIPYVSAKGSLFVWLDMSSMLKSQSANAEHQLWQKLYDETGILLTPGTGFGHTKFGQFRLVHPFVEKKVLEEAMSKFEGFVESHTSL